MLPFVISALPTALLVARDPKPRFVLAVAADITNGQITNADISSSAAIAGSKINPDFGSQSVTGSSFTGNGANLTNINAVELQGRTVSSTAPSTNQILKWNGSAWTPASDGGLTGTVPITSGGTGATSAAAARTNLGLGSLATKSAVSSSDITNGTITNTDINTNANIAGTKTDGNFGSKDVQTSGNFSYTRDKDRYYVILPNEFQLANNSNTDGQYYVEAYASPPDEDGYGYIDYGGEGDIPVATATLRLPEGAYIKSMDIIYHDNSAEDRMIVAIKRRSYSGSIVASNVGVFNTSFVGGPTKFEPGLLSNINHTVQNTNYGYYVSMTLENGNSSNPATDIGVKSVRIQYSVSRAD
jgi:hypothetical protein